MVYDSPFLPSEGSEGLWESDWFSLSYAATRQWLKQIRLRVTGDVVVTVLTEGREQRINLRGSDSAQRLNVNLKGEAFKIRIESSNRECSLSDLVCVVAFGRAN